MVALYQLDVTSYVHCVACTVFRLLTRHRYQEGSLTNTVSFRASRNLRMHYLNIRLEL